MSDRTTGVLALGRFLAVERYCQATQPSAIHPPVQRSRPSGGAAARPVPASGSRTPGRPEHG